MPARSPGPRSTPGSGRRCPRSSSTVGRARRAARRPRRWSPPRRRASRSSTGMSELVTPSLGPHAVYTVSPAGARGPRRPGRRGRGAGAHPPGRDRGGGAGLRRRDGPPPGRVCSTGRGSSGRAWWAPTGAGWTTEELAALAGAGATIVTNPVSNQKLATGRTFPWPAARAAGVPVGLGTDGAASNNSLDLLADVKVLALVAEGAPPAIPRSSPRGRPGPSPPGRGPRPWAAPRSPWARPPTCAWSTSRRRR